jgi:hypothetical protein
VTKNVKSLIQKLFHISALCDAEARDQPYLTKLRVTKNVKSLIQKLFHFQCWEEAG